MSWRPVALCLLAAALVGLSVAPAAGEHTPYHRYFITGVVTDASGQPLCGIVVRATYTDVPSPDTDRTATTDGQGRYLIQLHLHSVEAVADGEAATDDENGRIVVTLEATGSTREVLAQRNAGNPNGWGQQVVDFLGVSGVESPSMCAGQIALYGAAAIGGVAAVAVGWRFARRPRRHGRRRSALHDVPGIGRARARELESAGIRTVEELASAKPDALASHTALTPKQARGLVKRARELVDADE